MDSEFDLIFDDFDAELAAIQQIAVMPAGMHSSLPPKARIAASNAATLLLAATFEEFIRQQVRAAFRERARRAASITEFPDKLLAAVWRRSLEKLAKMPFDQIELDTRAIESALASTFSFCIKKETAADVGDTICHNDQNMRVAELSRLFNQIGLSNIVFEACKTESLKTLFGTGGHKKRDNSEGRRFF